MRQNFYWLVYKIFWCIHSFHLIYIYPLSISLNPAIHRMDNSQNFLCPRCREQDESYPCFIFHWNLSKATQNFISGLINLNYIFNTPFKVNPKAKALVNGGFIFQFHDGLHFKTLPTLLEVFFTHFMKRDMTKLRNSQI